MNAKLKTAIVAALVVAVTPIFAPATQANDPLARTPDVDRTAPVLPVVELRYPLDGPAKLQEFQTTGTFGIRLPLVGGVTIKATVAEWFDPEARPYAFADVPVTGHVEGIPQSMATLVLGVYGVYGTVELPLGVLPIRFEHDGVRTATGDWEGRARLSSSSVEAVGPANLARLAAALAPRTETHDLNMTGLPVPAFSVTDPGGEGFEDGTGGWSFNGLWHHSNTGLYSAWNAWYGIHSTGNYETGSDRNLGDLFSPTFYVPTGARLSFQSTYKTEDTGVAWDQKTVHISTDNGATWQKIHQVSGEPEATWRTEIVHLDDYSGANAMLRFRFDTIDGLYNNYAGWHVDDIAVTGTTGPPGPGQCETPAPGTGVQTKPWYDGGASGKASPQPPDPCAAQPSCDGGYAISWITYHAEQRFVEAEPNWHHRIMAAHYMYAPLWKDVCIALRPWPVALDHNVLLNGDCQNYSVYDQYSNYIKNVWSRDDNAFNDDAYQLWTSFNLYWSGGWPPEAYCFGLSFPDTVDIARTGFAFEAVSVVEGTDFSADTYNANNPYEQGVISGHELAHVYGEENHPYDCEFETWPPDNCNLMRRCTSPATVDFYLIRTSRQEIMFKFHYGTNPTTGWENKPECP